MYLARYYGTFINPHAKGNEWEYFILNHTSKEYLDDRIRAISAQLRIMTEEKKNTSLLEDVPIHLIDEEYEASITPTGKRTFIYFTKNHQEQFINGKVYEATINTQGREDTFRYIIARIIPPGHN